VLARFRRYFDASVDVPGRARVLGGDRFTLVIGVVERDGETLYCTALFLSPEGYLGRPPGRSGRR
jgi:nitrilase